MIFGVQIRHSFQRIHKQLYETSLDQQNILGILGVQLRYSFEKDNICKLQILWDKCFIISAFSFCAIFLVNEEYCISELEKIFYFLEVCKFSRNLLHIFIYKKDQISHQIPYFPPNTHHFQGRHFSPNFHIFPTMHTQQF